MQVANPAWSQKGGGGRIHTPNSNWIYLICKILLSVTERRDYLQSLTPNIPYPYFWKETYVILEK